jgi:predicted transcriptional regulator
MSGRDFKIGIISEDEFFEEIHELAVQADKGVFPEKPVERVYFGDMKTFLEYITPKRFILMDTLHKSGPLSIYALAKVLNRHYKNVHDDVKALESIGLVEKDENGRYIVPWEEITASTKLAA